MQEMTYFGPLAKVSLLAGQNNVGKSNVIRFLERFLKTTPEEPDWRDAPRGGGPGITTMIGCQPDPERYALISDNASQKRNVDLFLSLKPFHPVASGNVHWLLMTPKGSRGGPGSVDSAFLNTVRSEVETWNHQAQIDSRRRDVIDLRQVVNDHIREGSGDVVERTVRWILPFKVPDVEVIKAFRQINSDEAGEADHSGSNLIRTLAQHQNPDAQHRDRLDKFTQINRFVSDVLEDESVAIEVPFERDHLLVHERGDVFPLEDLGTGIHQTVIIAAAATLLDKTLVCIEEPEVNLHPILQRKLVRYLAENTTNQYVIATHSAHMLDYERSSVIHLRKGESGTEAAPAASPADVASVCADLGYRPSDILQSNAVIWVEGPSDRTYLTHWIDLVEPDSGLIEGIHYTVMFYGGRLMNHLSANDPEAADELISLRRINRHSMIVIDSDRTRARGRLNETKRRVISEFEAEDQPGHAWTTSGYTIENYIPADLLNLVVRKVHSSANPRWDGGLYDNPLKVTRKGSSKVLRVDKVRIADEVCREWSDQALMSTALKREVNKALKFIREAN